MINHVSRGGIYWTTQTCLTNLKFSEHLLFANLNDFSLKSTDFARYTHKCKLSFFCKNFFYKNCIFTKKNFMLNQSSWGCFLDHLDLPYQFGILIMSTFCWNELFFTKANWIYAIWINVSPVFFASPLTTYLYK